MTSPNGVGVGRSVLIVEDDKAMSVALCDGLASEGFEVISAVNGEDGLSLASARTPDVIVLDVMLPRLNGLDLCRKLRAAGDNVPIIMLTARGQEADRVLGLKLGADDYVTKPYSARELRARIKAVLRRTSDDASETYRFGDCEVDLGRRELKRGGAVVALTPLEFKLLSALVRHRGRAMSRQQLIDEAWGSGTFVTDRVVDNQVTNLRRKIEADPSRPAFVLSMRGFGYRFDG
jgi:DNA-binding response OmpR family regulator